MNNLTRSNVRYKSTNLDILCETDYRKCALEEVIHQYTLLEEYIQKDPLFLSTYEPLRVDAGAPEIARLMAEAAMNSDVGPMAAVAGAFSEIVAKRLQREGAREVIVENGGDIYMTLKEPRTVGIYAGGSRFSGKIGLRIEPGKTPLGICTSSGSVGHSVSLGSSDAVTVVAGSSILADAAATAIANHVRGETGIDEGLKAAGKIKGIRGVLIIKDDRIGARGDLPEIIKTQSQIDYREL